MQVRAAGAGGEPGVFVFGVDDPALGALVGVAQDLQLGQVGLPGAGGGEGDGVVVVARPPVPGDQARPGGVRAVQDAGQRAGVSEALLLDRKMEPWDADRVTTRRSCVSAVRMVAQVRPEYPKARNPAAGSPLTPAG